MTVVSSPRISARPRIDPPSRHRTPYQRFAVQYPNFIDELRLSRTAWATEVEALTHLTRREQHSQVRRILRNQSLKLHFAFEALKRCNQLQQANPSSVLDLANEANPFAPVRGEQVVSRLVRKGSGQRWVQDFGPRRRMHQLAIASILRALHPPPSNQKLFNGGMPAALRAVATAYSGDGMTHGVEIDFIDFYGSITNVSALADLLRPLPTSVVENVVWDVAMRDGSSVRVADASIADPTPSVPTGLSLGAATSPIVGERIMARLLAAAEQPDMISYADNLFALGRSDQEVSARIHRIRESVASAEVGRLGLRVDRDTNFALESGFEFLKHEGMADNGGIRWRPGHQKMAQYQITVREKLTVDQIASAERRVKHWRRSYPDWHDGDAHEAMILAELASRRYFEARNPENLSDAIRAIFIAVHLNPWALPSDIVPTEGASAEVRQHLLARAMLMRNSGVDDTT